MKRALIVSLLALTFMVPASSVLALDIGLGIGGCNATAGGGAASQVTAVPITNTEIENNTKDLRDKECVGNRLQYLISQALIASITNSIISWINSGFEGGPGFITNYSQFFGNIADNVALNFINGVDLGFACTPFEIPLKQALIQNYQQQNSFSQRISCSLGDVIGPFLQGDFSQGGWQSLFRLSLEPQNNPLYVYTSALDEQASRTASEQQTQLLETSGGFLSKGTCDTTGGFNPDAGDPNTREGCKAGGGTWRINNPASQVQAVISKVLNLPLDQLVNNDQLGESLNSIYGALIQQAFTSLQGLSGLSSRSSSSAFNGQSYLSQLTTETGNASLGDASDALISDIDYAIELEKEYQSTLDGFIADYEDVETSFNQLKSCSTSGVGQEALNALNAIDNLLSDYKNTRAQSDDVLAQLLTVRSKAGSATTVAALNAAGTAYEQIIPLIHTSSQITLETQGETATILSYESQIQNGKSLCGL